MISDYLDRDYVLSETRAHRDALVSIQKQVAAKDKTALAELKDRKIKPAELDRAIEALNDALKRASDDKSHPQGTAYIPQDPVTCSLQAGMTKLALADDKVEANKTKTSPAPATRGKVAKRATRQVRGKTTTPPDTSPQLRLQSRTEKPTKTRSRDRAVRAPFLEGTDWHYALDGFKAKFGNLFKGRRPFNRNPARIAASDRPLTLFLFGDWGTGLPLAAQVTKRIAEQLENMDSSRQPHVIHLGDVYYVGEPEEYERRVFPFWPVQSKDRNAIGSWSINGNHDMYSSGEGYFDTLLRNDVMLRWHADRNGQPSSFFLIEDADWQVFGLDTSWSLPSLGSTIFGEPTFEDYKGQNGVLTKEQVAWMAQQRNGAKGCILLTHHQPASSRTSEAQHADEAVGMMKDAGIYSQIDAWLWGHEHRCVVFKPKAERTTKRLKDAPNFCVCLGHGGVPVTEKNFEAKHKIADVHWEEDRLDSTSPIYEGSRIVPFGFARIDTQPNAFQFQVFDHTGSNRYECVVQRTAAAAPPSAVRSRSAAKPKKKLATKTSGKKAASKKPATKKSKAPKQ